MHTLWKRQRVVMIGVFSVLMLAAVFVVGTSLRGDYTPRPAAIIGDEGTPSIPTEVGVFRDAKRALAYKQMPEAPENPRTLAVYYSRRA